MIILLYFFICTGPTHVSEGLSLPLCPVDTFMLRT